MKKGNDRSCKGISLRFIFFKTTNCSFLPVTFRMKKNLLFSCLFDAPPGHSSVIPATARDHYATSPLLNLEIQMDAKEH